MVRFSGMLAIDYMAFVTGCIFAALAVPFFILDWRMTERGNYLEKYGLRSSSVWMIPAMAFVVLAMYWFHAAFTRT
jgi:hypothetical protein